MTKAELIAELAATRPQLHPVEVELIVNTVFDRIAQALADGDRVELRGFGAFTVKQRDARTGRNPRTGAEVPVAAKTLPAFKAASRLRARVNRPARRRGT